MSDPYPSKGKVYVDPKLFKESELPVIVLTDDLRGFIGWAIKAHTKGNYGHVFIMHTPGLCVSQDFGGFREKKIEKYMVNSIMLKFWRIKNLNSVERAAILLAVDMRIKLPRWKRMYDYLGLVGQFFHIRQIQNPWKLYCSEQVKVDYLDPIERTHTVNFGRPSPSDLDRIFIEHPDIFEVAGYWWNG